MFSKQIFKDLVGLVNLSSTRISTSSTILKLLSNAIESYNGIIKEVNEGKIRFIDLTEEDIKFIKESIESINTSLATSVYSVIEILVKSKLDTDEFTVGVQTFLKEHNLDLINYEDPLFALEAYGNHKRIENLMVDLRDLRITVVELENYIKEDPMFKAGMVLDFGKTQYLWAMLGRASVSISDLENAFEANNKEAIYIFISALANIFVITSSMGLDVKYITDIVKL